MPKRFRVVRSGYDPQLVDAHIDRLETENERLSRVNNELYHMWLSDLGKRQSPASWAESDLAWAMGADEERERDKWNRLYALLDESSGNVAGRQAWQAQSAQASPPPPQKKRNRVGSMLSTTFFYLLIITAVLGAFFFAGSNDNVAAPPQNIAGFSAMTVLTRVMQSTIPQRSLIATRRVDPATIQVGDDITFLMRGNFTNTHRVIEVIEDYYRGERGFRTQGTDNAQPDSETVLASNIVGLVVFHSLAAGNVILFIRHNIILVVGALVAVIVVYVLLRFLLFKKVEPEDVKVPQG